jgi:PAS domain S-box-containing protein
MSGMQTEFSRLVDALPGLVWTAAADGSAGSVNRRWRDYAGLAPGEAASRDWLAAVHPDDLADARDRWTTAIGRGAPCEIEARLRRADGAYRRFAIAAHPLRTAQGEIAGWCAINNDIEDRRRAEEQLAAEKRLLELVARGMALPDVLEELCHEVEGLGPGSFCSILSVEPEGRRFRVAAGPTLPQRYNDALEGRKIDPRYGPCSMAAETRSTIIAANPPRDPRWQCSEWPGLLAEVGLGSCWSTPIFGSRQDVLGIFAIYRQTFQGPTPEEQELIDRFAKIAGIAIERAQSDAALKANAAELRRANTYLTAAQRLTQTGSFTWDVQKDEHNWSEVVYRMFGIAPGARVTMADIQAAIHPEDMADVQAQLGQAAHGANFELVFRILPSDGEVRHAHVVGHRIDQIPDRPVFMGAVQDITARKLAEDDLNRARAELAHVARVTALSALTASIAHEVAQPLAGIITNASTCLRMLAADPADIEGARATAQRTIRDGDRASDVIRRLRALFARKAPILEPIDLNEAAREVLALSSSELQRRRVAVRTDFAIDLPRVLADKVQLQQVILNLVLNAADAMDGIDDRSRNMWLTTARGADGAATLLVRDAGVGLDAEAAVRLFDAFHTTKPDGMGIGLSISRSIIESHGGRIAASPNKGTPGATVSFSIPCAAATATSLESRTA